MNLDTVYSIIREKPLFINYLIEKRLINEFIECDACGYRMNLIRSEKYGDGYCFKCFGNACNKEKSIRYGSFFSKSKLSMEIIFKFIYMWTQDFSGPNILNDVKVNKNTMGDFKRFIREKIVVFYETSTRKIGGPGKIVEIDETLVSKRKYNVGRIVEPVWVFGGVERGENGGQVPKNSFAFVVPNRTRLTLLHYIFNFIAPGTHIMSDGWGAYRTLSRYGYIHDVVVHNENFVSPVNSTVHTQNIEGMWSVLKRKLRKKGTHIRPFINEYVLEALFRYQNKENLFDEVIRLLVVQ